MGSRNSKKENIPSLDRNSLYTFDSSVLNKIADKGLPSTCVLSLNEHFSPLADEPELFKKLTREELNMSERQTMNSQLFHSHNKTPESYIGRSTTKQLKESEELCFHRHSHFQTRAPNSCKEEIAEELKKCKELDSDIHFAFQTGTDKSCKELSSTKEIKPLHELNLLNTSSHTLETPMDCKELTKTDESKEYKELDLNMHTLSKTEANADYREVITKEDLKNTSLDYSSNFSLPDTSLENKDKDTSMQSETAPVNICSDLVISWQVGSDTNLSRDTKHNQNLDNCFDIKHDSNSIQHSPKILDNLNQDTLGSINLVNNKDTSDCINPMNDEKKEKNLHTSNETVNVDLNSDDEFNFEKDLNRAGSNIKNNEAIARVDAINKAQSNDSILLGNMNISDTIIDSQPEEYCVPQSVSDLIESKKDSQIKRKKEKKCQKKKKQKILLKDVTSPQNSYVGEKVAQVCENISAKASINDTSMEKINSVNFTGKNDLATSDIKENYKENEQILKADQYKKQGNQFYSLKFYTGSVEAYSKAICLDPTDPVLFLNRSSSLIMLRNFMQAAEDAERAVEINYTFGKGFLHLAKCYIALGLGPQANFALEKCRNLCFTNENLGVKMEDVLEEIARSFNLIMKMERGDEAMKNGNFAKALSYYQKALEIAVADVYLFLRVAKCLNFLKRLKEVLPLIKSIPEELMKEDEVSLLKGLYFYYGSEFSEAKEHLLKVQVRPLNAEAQELLKKIDKIEEHFHISNEAMHNEDISVALHTLKIGLKIDPYNYNVNAKFHYWRGVCCIQQESWSDAIYFLSEAISLKKDFLAAYQLRGKCFYYIKDFEAAAADWKYS